MLTVTNEGLVSNKMSQSLWWISH